jgi:hypothetical protein
MFFYPMQAKPPSVMSTLDMVRDWCIAAKLKDWRVEPADGERAVKVTAGGVAVSFSLPVPASSLAWTFKGEP